MQDSKKGNLPSFLGHHLSLEDCPKAVEERDLMSKVPCASAMGSLMYAMLCTRPNKFYAVGTVSRYQSNLGP